ncbi:hypothetical protein BKA70DRAFT_1310130 [Coprinopsis sp. MPI-PUGE-AT-0042]|nr:hypothetical protein BKA70DRAFT_1310130 [Coprinopsis sp. MPI-PUGE-AT-0042]
MQPDQRIVPYTLANDPLPSYLKPAAVEYNNHLTNSIALLDEEITLLEDTLRQRKQKRKEISDRREPFAALLCSPIRLVPPEVIATIISQCLAGEGHPLNDVGRRSFARYRAVCRLWRNISFSTPALWRSLEVEACNFHQLPNFVATLQSWFSRAGQGAPLELKLAREYPACDERYCMEGQAQELRLLSNLLFGPDTALRFQSVVWDRSILSEEGIRALLEPETSCSSLETLSIFYPGSDVEVFPGIGSIFPLLQNLYISTPLSQTIATQLFPHAHPGLRTLCLFGEGGSMHDVHTLLTLLPGLEELSLQLTGSSVSSNMAMAPFIHKKIKSFLIGANGPVPDDVFSTFVFPSLELLVFNGELPRLLVPPSEGYPGLDRFLKACHPKKLTFALESSKYESFKSALPDLVAIIRDLPIPSKQIVWDSSHIEPKSIAVICRSVCEGGQGVGHASNQPLRMYCQWPGEGELYNERREGLRAIGVELINLSLAEVDLLTHQPIRYRRLRHDDHTYWLWTLRD